MSIKPTNGKFGLVGLLILAFSCLLPDKSVYAAFPAASTGSASSISATSVILNGTVNDNGANTDVYFDYGLTTGYGSSVAITSPPATVTSGSGSTPVSVLVNGLGCHTTYHYRVRGVNSSGTTNGSDANFTTGLASPRYSRHLIALH